jgi:hypothetical protein
MVSLFGESQNNRPLRNLFSLFSLSSSKKLCTTAGLGVEFQPVNRGARGGVSWGRSMDENILTFNFTNWITIVIMAALGFALLGWGQRAWAKRQGA